MELIVITLAALVTAVLSAVAGLGGGIVLLAVIAQFHAPVVAIPIHGGFQLASNASRATILRSHINWSAVARASILLFPAALLGVLVATSVPEDATRIVLGAFVLVVTWRPSLLKWRGRQRPPDNVLVGVGAVSGFLSATVGASGPFTSPFFRLFTATHTAFVATAATSQVVAHAAKLGAFATEGFALSDHIGVIALGAAAVSVGSLIGTRLLGRLDESQLATVLKAVLTILAVRLIFQGLT
ncbi:MAG: sulfite exporter TauE/SafE family protein [Actinomycetota bacterium]